MVITNSLCPNASAQVNLPFATLKVVLINSSPASEMFISLESSLDTSQSTCSLILFAVNGLAVNLITGSIGLPTIFPCPVGNKWILNPPAACKVIHSAAAECVTLQAAGGFNIHLFPTGQGNIIGNPIEPVVKLTANPLTAKSMSEHVDCDVSKLLSREMNMSDAGDELIKTTLRVANGRLTCAEALGHREFVMTKLYRSA